MDLIATKIADPSDYLQGIGFEQLVMPKNILFFRRLTTKMLQQDNIENKSHHRVVVIFNFMTIGYVHLDHLAFRFSPNQALVIHPHQFHHFSNLESQQLNWLITTFELDDVELIESLRNRVVELSDATIASLQETFSLYVGNHTKKKSSGWDTDELQVTLLNTLIKLKQDQVVGQSTFDVLKNDLVSKVNRVLTDTQKRELSVPFIAEKVRMSESRVRALFKQVSGVPLGKYIMNYKIHVSLSFLSDPSLRVTEVADLSGFGSVQAFSRSFKQQVGQSPQHWRQGRQK